MKRLATVFYENMMEINHNDKKSNLSSLLSIHSQRGPFDGRREGIVNILEKRNF